MRSFRTIRHALALSTFSVPATAAVAPADAPVISAEVTAGIAAERKVEQAFPVMQSQLGAWVRQSHLEASILADAFEIGRSNVALNLSTAGIAAGFPYNQRKVALRINDGLDHIGEEVVPPLADDAGLDHLDVVSSLTLWSSVGDCNTYRFKLKNVFVELPFGRNAVDGEFRDGKKVLSDFDLPSAEAHAEVEFTITNTSSSGWCFFDPVPALDIEAEFTVSDLSGHLDATLRTSGDTIAINTVDDIDFSLNDFVWDTNSWFLDSVIALGFGLYDLFDASCSGQADCLSEAINEYALEDDDFVDEMKALVNDAIDAPLTINTGVSTDGLNLNFAVDLDSLKSSTVHNTMTSLWNVTPSTSAAANACAAALTAKAYALEGSTGDAQLTADEMELEIPFHILSKTAYYAGKQGLFCKTGSYSVLGVPRSFNIVPNGAVGVSKGSALDPDNLIKFSLPIKATPSVGAGIVNATLTISGLLSVDAGSDLVFTTTAATASALSGSLTLGGLSISAATLTPAINTALAGIVTGMNDIELLNAVVQTGITGVSIAASDVTTDGQALVVGLNFN